MKVLAVALVAFGLALAGCSSKYRLDRDRLEVRPDWPYHRGAASGIGVSDGSWDGQLRIVWQHRTNGKPAGPLTIHHSELAYPNTRKKLEFFDMASGAKHGKLKIVGHVATGLVAKDSIGCYALSARKNRVEAVNLLNRKELWQQPVKDAVPGSIILGKSLIVSSGDGWVQALNIDDGSLGWRTNLESRCIAPPSAARGLVFQPADRGEVVALSADSGIVQYRMSLDAATASAVAVDRLVYATDVNGRVYAFDPIDGSTVWRAEAGGPIWCAPVVTRNLVIVGQSVGAVIAFDAESGTERWRFDCQKVVRAAPIVVGKFVVVGTMAGSLFVLAVETGEQVDSTELSGAIARSPVSNGRHVIVATEKGYITCFGEPNEQQHNPADQRVHSQN